LSSIITKTITGIIANDYRTIYGDIVDEEEHGPNPKGGHRPQSLANGEERGPNPKGVAGLHKGMRLMVQV